MLDFFPGTVRSEGLDFQTAVAKWSLPGARVLELFYPQLYQSLFNQMGMRWLSAMYEQGEPFVTNFYVGFVVAICFAAGIVAWRRGSGLALSAFVALFVIALGNGTPLLRILFDIGVFKTMRFPEKFFIGASLVAVIWGALTADRLLNGDERVRKAVLYVTITWLALGFFLILGATRVWAPNWVLIFVRGGILIALVLLARRGTFRWSAALVPLLFLDLLHLRTVNDTITRQYFTEPAVAQQLDPRRSEYRIFHRAEWEWMDSVPNADEYFRPPEWRWWALRNSLMPRNGALFGFRYVFDRDYDQTFLLRTSQFLRAMLILRRANAPFWDEHMMAMSNAWYSGAFRSFRAEAGRLGNRYAEVFPVDFTLGDRHPRYYFADEIEPISGEADFISKLAARRWSPRVAFLEDPPFAPATARVLSAKETMSSATLEVESQGRALLVLSVTGDRYWRAHIDGMEVRPQPANLAYQAVEVPAGRHRVEMKYVNPLVVPSAIVSLVAVIVCLFGGAGVLAPATPGEDTRRSK